MNRLISFSLLLLLSTHWLLADDVRKPDNETATATVFADKCQFVFPIEDMERAWKWGVSPANYCEYSWMVTINGDDAKYQVGLSYFNPDAIPQSGSFDQLLATGQADVWKLEADGNGASYVEGVRVNCESKGDTLRITVENKAWIKRLFGKEPKSVRFETSGTQLKASKTDVIVEYKMDAMRKDR